MKHLTLAACLLSQAVFFSLPARAADLSLSGILDWTDHIAEVVRELDRADVPTHRAETEWDMPRTAEPRKRFLWRQGRTEMRPWVRMDEESAGAGLLLEF